MKLKILPHRLSVKEAVGKIKSPQRALLYSFLILFVGAITTWWLIARTSLSENFFAGAVDLFITVFIVERLILADRTRRLKQINIESSDWVAKSICFSVVLLADTMGYKIKDQLSVGEYDHKKLGELVERIFGSKNYKEYLQSLYVLDPKTISKFEALKITFEENRKRLSKAVKSVKPYLDPELSQVIMQNSVNANVLTEVPLQVLKIVYEDMPKDGHPIDPNDSQFWDGFKVMWERLVLNHETVGSGENFDESLRKIVNIQLDILKRAKDNDLFYDA